MNWNEFLKASEDLQTLAEEAKQDVVGAREKLTKCFIINIKEMASYYADDGTLQEELVNEGSLGFAIGLDDIYLLKDGEEIDYIVNRVGYRMEIAALMQNIIVDDLQVTRGLEKIVKAIDYLEKKHCRTVTHKEIAEYLKISKRRVDELIRIYRDLIDVSSLDYVNGFTYPEEYYIDEESESNLGEEDDGNYKYTEGVVKEDTDLFENELDPWRGEVVGNPDSTLDADYEFMKDWMEEDIDEVMQIFQKEKKYPEIIKMYYGFETGSPKTIAEIATELDLTESVVDNRLKRGTNRIRAWNKNRDLFRQYLG